MNEPSSQIFDLRQFTLKKRKASLRAFTQLRADLVSTAGWSKEDLRLIDAALEELREAVADLSG